MQLKTLTAKQVTDIYQTYMVKDFPRSELKPLAMILNGMKKGKYECLGFYEEDLMALRAYAIFIKKDNDYLLDYLAVLNGNRGRGIGSACLKCIAEYYKKADSIILEVEDPDCARSQEEIETQKRRIRFYIQNDCIDTGVRTKLFGVDFRILELKGERKHSQQEIKSLYKVHYKSLLPVWLYLRKVKVKQ